MLSVAICMVAINWKNRWVRRKCRLNCRKSYETRRQKFAFGHCSHPHILTRILIVCMKILCIDGESKWLPSSDRSHHYFIEDRKDIPELSPFASWSGGISSSQWLELPISRNVHGRKWCSSHWLSTLLIYDTIKVKKECLWKERTHKITQIGDSVWLSIFICNTVVREAAYAN